MPDAVTLVHADCEGPALIAALLREQGRTVDIRPVHRGAEVPTAIPAGGLLVVMGGSMGVGDLHVREFAFLQREVSLLQRCLDDGTPILGVCLGSQLLAHAAGARVAPMRSVRTEAPYYEVGWGEVAFAREADIPVLEGIPALATMLHWHGDTFDLPPGARRLASTTVCPEQGFQIGRRVFGLQFHPELGMGELEEYLASDADYVVQANGPDGVDRIRADANRYFGEYRAVSERLLRNIVREMAAA